MSITINHPVGAIDATVLLPASKSESNRLLILEALSGGKIKTNRLSDARDTRLLQAALATDQADIDIEDAGTTMRFLTAYYCAAGQHKILTGSARMKERPIGTLINALREIGFHIHYPGMEGYPPIEIIPDRGELKNEVHIAGNISSQYISALLMIAPVLSGGLTIYFDTAISSRPYVELTLDIMAKAGIRHEWLGDQAIKIPAQTFQEKVLVPAVDWSSAGYWYAIAALAEKATINLTGLSFDTAQGDKKIAEWMETFGVTTKQNPGGLTLLSGQDKNQANPENHVNHTNHINPILDFCHQPDLAQTMIVLCAAKNIKATFTGLQSLRIKETDRIAALQNELSKFGVDLMEGDEGEFHLRGNFTMSQQTIKIYNDHRMAMAFAPLALLGAIGIGNPEVVEKSYPHFWREMEKAGFMIK